MADELSAAVVRELLAALDEPGEINSGLVLHVRAQLQEALDALEAAPATTPVAKLDERRRMPTLGVPLAALEGAPDDEPPIPPSAL
ncbi:hypothetical protein HQQ81_08095 [Microbacteriaceae bacterium VKM Ac-2854]|nr:hypothetical protein [Microbacteriaceae bacterium VKM Ac-2854]